jgi:hypothetical protein
MAWKEKKRCKKKKKMKAGRQRQHMDEAGLRLGFRSAALLTY